MTSPPPLLPFDLLVTKPHWPVPTGRQRARESVESASACQSPGHRGGKRRLEGVSDGPKESYPALFFSRVSEQILLCLLPGQQNSEVTLRAEFCIFDY